MAHLNFELIGNNAFSSDQKGFKIVGGTHHEPYANSAEVLSMNASGKRHVGQEFKVWNSDSSDVDVWHFIGGTADGDLVKKASGGGGGGGITSIVAGTNVTVNSADPANPIVSGSTPDLQAVTDAGNITTDTVIVKNLSSNSSAWYRYSNIRFNNDNGNRVTLDSNNLTTNVGVQLELPCALIPSSTLMVSVNGVLADVNGNVNTRLKSYTVATLPSSPTQGDEAAVTDATSPTYLGTLTGGGTTYTPVIFNGTIWISH